MTSFPRHPVLRGAAALWLLASVVMLVATFLRPDINGMDRSALVYLTPLYWLSFPLGHVGVIAGIQIRLELYLKFNFVPSVFAEGIYLWTSLTILGFVQWFVLLPWISRKCRQLSHFLFNCDPGEGTHRAGESEAGRGELRLAGTWHEQPSLIRSPGFSEFRSPDLPI